MWNMENLLDNYSLLNLMVVGDSEYEINAGKHFKVNMKYDKKCLIKLIKFKEDANC
jgi:hypothetical protein